jgi:RNA polymerase sigma-70 factor (family 1)
MEITPIELFELIRHNDQAAYEKLFRQNYVLLVRFAKDIVKDKDTAEDLVQEVFVKIWERRESIEIKTSVKAYLYMAVKNHCFTRLKAEQRHAYMDESLADDLRFSDNDTDKDTNTIDLHQHISNALDKLPPRCALIFKMSRFEYKTYQEIADVLELSVKTVENQMSKALQLMRTSLSVYLRLVAILPAIKFFFH